MCLTQCFCITVGRAGKARQRQRQRQGREGKAKAKGRERKGTEGRREGKLHDVSETAIYFYFPKMKKVGPGTWIELEPIFVMLTKSTGFVLYFTRDSENNKSVVFSIIFTPGLETQNPQIDVSLKWICVHPSHRFSYVISPWWILFFVPDVTRGV